MKRQQVYESIDSERDYQNYFETQHDSHVSATFNYGDALTAIRVNLQKAEEAWYNSIQQYEKPNEFLRKVAAICVKMGEDYGMPKREFDGKRI